PPCWRRGHVEDDDLVRALRLVLCSLSRRITRVTQVLEPHALYDPTVPHVEAGHDARQEPGRRTLARRSGRGDLCPCEPALQQRRPVSAGQLRVKLAREDAALLQFRHAPHAVRCPPWGL